MNQIELLTSETLQINIGDVYVLEIHKTVSNVPQWHSLFFVK